MRVIACPLAAVIGAFIFTSAASAYEETLTLQASPSWSPQEKPEDPPRSPITPSGLKAVNDPVTHDISGRVVRAEVADIDANAIRKYMSSPPDGRQETRGVVAYAVNKKKSMSQIFLPDFTEDAKLAKGYAGGEESAVVETSFVTRFKIHEDGKPTDKWRQLHYKLKPGEAGWKLVLEKTEEF